MFCVASSLFGDSLKAASRDYQKELNYQEAFKESYVAYAPPGLPSEVETLLASAKVRRAKCR